LRFFGATGVLGTATILFVTTLQAILFPGLAAQGAYREMTGALTGVLATLGTIKLCAEACVFLPLRSPESSPLKRTAQLMTGELAEITTARFLFGVIGEVVLPLAFLVRQPAPGFATLGVTLWIMVFALLGELLERHLFFVAIVPARMPGGIGS
jgi:hypothetical protein